MDAADVVRLIEARRECWWIMPSDDVMVMGAEAPTEQPGVLTLYLAGPTSDESRPIDFRVELIDEVEDGLYALWCAYDMFQLPRNTTETIVSPVLLVRRDKLASVKLMGMPA